MAGGSGDRRGFLRIPFRTGVEIVAGTFELRSDGHMDISMSGLRLAYSGGKAPAPGTPCRASIILYGSGPGVSISATGRITRADPGSLVVEFSRLDPDSYQHLRQLILHNAEDPEKAEQEFDAHWGIRKPGSG